MIKKWYVLPLFLIGICLGPILKGYCECHDFQLSMIDVGEGDSLVIQTPNKKIIVIDSGNADSGFNTVDFLKSKKISKIDTLIFTHPHLDHVGELLLLSIIL